jgi:hypothetical protein
MPFKNLRAVLLLFLLAVTLWSNAAPASSYQYIRMGEKTDSLATPSAGTAMMGGGEDLDDAFRLDGCARRRTVEIF